MGQVENTARVTAVTDGEKLIAGWDALDQHIV